MYRLAHHCCALLLGLPLAASAEAVRITTEASGVMQPNPLVLQYLGMEMWDVADGQVPYRLRMVSFVDPDGPAYDWPSGGIMMFDRDVALSLTVGEASYQYAGKAEVRLNGGSMMYGHEITIQSPVSNMQSVSLGIWTSSITDSLPADLFAPRTIYYGSGYPGTIAVATWSANPDGMSTFSMSAATTSLALQVGAVPEPATTGLLAAGVVVLGLHRRRQRRRES